MARQENVRKFFRENFLSGLLIVLPIGASFYVLLVVSRWLYRKVVILPLVPESLLEIIHEVLPGWVYPWAMRSIHLAEFLVLLFGLFSVIAFIGLIAKLRLVHWMLDLGERTLRRIPLIGTIYSAVQQLMQALFSGQGNFSQVVLVQFPRAGMWSMGFLSRELDPALARKANPDALHCIFIPTTPNVTTGFLVMVPERDFTPLDLTIENAFKIIMSGGMAQPQEQFEHPLEKLRRTDPPGPTAKQ